MNIVERLSAQHEMTELTVLDLEAYRARLLWTEERGRGDQMPPPERWDKYHLEAGECTEEQLGEWRDDWFVWLMMAGRGSGKTRAGAEDAWWFAYQNPGCRIAVVGPTSNDARKTCFEGESGLLSVIPKNLIASWNRGEMLLTLTNGSIFQGYSAEEPDRLRGPQHHRAWCDELAAWKYLDDTLDNLLMGLRLGEQPRVVATTTPRPITRLKEMVADETTWVDTVSTYANAENLPKIFLSTILKRYEGTRLGRQELNAEILSDNPNALWQRAVIDETRIACVLPSRGQILLSDGRIVDLVHVVVAVDPASGGLGEDDAMKDTGDEWGVVVVGLGSDGRGYVLADCSLSESMGEIGKAIIRAYDHWKADCVVYEANQGGEMVRHLVVTAAASLRADGERDMDFVATRAVWASRGKETRAEPVSALYEQRRVSHVGCHAKLEDQMCEFTRGFDRKRMGYSPDRMDALVWGVTSVMLSEDMGTNVQDYYRQENSRHAEAVASAKGGMGFSAAHGDKIALVPPPNVTTAFGALGNKYTIDSDGLMWVHKSDVPPLTGAGYVLHSPQEAAA